ncbi:MAG: cobalamin biosynthesis protein CobW [Ruminococcaceae bacterium]|nr:cobalamin biosynthesis protein CobW [Oscillospiraceae bacterium]
MTKIDIFSGFLGAGKTTLIKKLINEAYKGEKIVLIENEFGEIGIDGSFLKDAGIEITEMNSGCICCSLVGDFSTALSQVIDEFDPDRILIEPSGVGKLSDVIRAVQSIGSDKITLNGFTTVVDANKCKMYMKNFGEFFNDQIEHASSIILSHTENISEDRLKTCLELLKEHNSDATIVTTPWTEIDGSAILAAMEKKNTLEAELARLQHEHHHHHDEHCECHEHEHHHHHEHDEHCDCGCHAHEHHHDEECDHHHHEHKHHDEHCDCHEHHHEHHHDHGEECTCGCHDHDHGHHHGHHHHHADEVFASIGRETARKYTVDEITEALNCLTDEAKYGVILRAKGIVAGTDGHWIHFDYVPGEPDVRLGSADITGRLCIIGSKINEQALTELFKL